MTTHQITAPGLRCQLQSLAPCQQVQSHSVLLPLAERRRLPLWKHWVLCPHRHSYYRALYPENAGLPQPEVSMLTPGTLLRAWGKCLLKTSECRQHHTQAQHHFLHGKVKCNCQGIKSTTFSE